MPKLRGPITDTCGAHCGIDNFGGMTPEPRHCDSCHIGPRSDGIPQCVIDAESSDA